MLIRTAAFGVMAIALSGCVGSGNLGGATREGSAEIVTIDLNDGRTLDCLSGPWENVIWFDHGIINNPDGTVVPENSAADRIADGACRQYFNDRSNGIPEETAAAEASRFLLSRL